MIERRRTRRLKVKNDTFVIHDGTQDMLGQVVDIGEGGLAFHYIGEPVRPPGIWKLNIRPKNSAMALENFNARTISDIEINYANPISQIPLRRCGVKFGLLSPVQIKQLSQFIHLLVLGPE